jgi:hypothetical protein
VRVGVVLAVEVTVLVGTGVALAPPGVWVGAGVDVRLGDGVRVDVGVMVGETSVTVKNAEESTPHWPLLLLPWMSTRWRPAGKAEILTVVVMAAVPPP